MSTYLKRNKQKFFLNFDSLNSRAFSEETKQISNLEIFYTRIESGNFLQNFFNRQSTSISSLSNKKLMYECFQHSQPAAINKAAILPLLFRTMQVGNVWFCSHQEENERENETKDKEQQFIRERFITSRDNRNEK